jgi:hypothetical protein
MLEALLQPRDRLLHHHRDAVQAAEDVLVLADAARGHHRQHARRVLLRAAHLADRQVLAHELLALDAVGELLHQQVVVEPVLALELLAVDALENLERAHLVLIAQRHRLERVVGPPIVARRVADHCGELGPLVHRVVEVDVDEVLKPLALGVSFLVRLERVDARQDVLPHRHHVLLSGQSTAGDEHERHQAQADPSHCRSPSWGRMNEKRADAPARNHSYDQPAEMFRRAVR